MRCGTRTRHRKDFERMQWNINTLDSEEEDLGSDEIGLCITSGEGIRCRQRLEPERYRGDPSDSYHAQGLPFSKNSTKMQPTISNTTLTGPLGGTKRAVWPANTAYFPRWGNEGFDNK